MANMDKTARKRFNYGIDVLFFWKKYSLFKIFAFLTRVWCCV